MLENLLYFKTLTPSENYQEEQRILEERGELVQIINNECFKHLVYIEIKPGFSRGKHYHLRHEESFYVISGTVKAIFEFIETKERLEKILNAGDKVLIPPRCAHVLSSIKYSQIIHFSKANYDPNDTYPYIFQGLQI